jgi:diketogulonate reductase-like aldo/keto reductase
MLTNLQSTSNLNNGVAMPWFGLGVFKTKSGKEVEKAVQWALEAGYRSIDTATVYGNEAGVGKALRRSEIPREELFVTTKVWNRDQRAGRVAEAFATSLAQLGLDYVDLYLVHWPVANHIKETWRILESIYESGKVKAIGVSNFMIPHLQELLDQARIVPAVNQIEMHPYLQQPDLIDYCRQHGIQVEAWSPIMRGEVTKVPQLKKLARKYGKNPVQVTLRWLLQKEIIVIPKSSKKKRIHDNAKVFDFALSAADMALIDGLDRGTRVGPDPFNFDF